MKKVSLIVAAYNAEKTIRRCLDSILNQTYKNIEVICVNDGSQDKTKEIIDEYVAKDKRVILIDQKKNRGVTYTKNNGIKNSTGDYITFVDSDDYVELDMVEKLLSFAKKYKLDLVRCDYNVYVGEKLTNNKLGFEKEMVLKDKSLIIDKLISGEIPGYLQLLLIKKDIIVENKLKIDKNLNFLEDLLFYFSLIKYSKKIGVIPNRLCNYCINNNGLTFSLNYNKIINRIDGIVYYYNHLIKENILNNNQIVNLSNSCFYMLNHSYFELFKIGKFNELKKHFAHCVCIINKCNEVNMDLFTRISLKLMKKNYYLILYVWYFIAKCYLLVKGN